MLIIKKIKQMIVEILANKSKMILIRMNINQLIIIKIVLLYISIMIVKLIKNNLIEIIYKIIKLSIKRYFIKTVIKSLILMDLIIIKSIINYTEKLSTLSTLMIVRNNNTCSMIN